MVVVAMIAYIALGFIVLAMLDAHSKGRLKAWFDSAPSELLKYVVLVGWPVVFAVFLYSELREALKREP